ncbi:MAG TPA: phenylalanine--tRNA ligase subunit beta [Candidatus Paceibacterota bacterium]
MKISHKWLQTFFKKPLPESEKIAELLTFHIFEVEGIEKKTDDDVLDVKVLPDRACYCLSHEGIARELSALISDNTFVPREAPEIEPDDVPELSVSIEAKDACDKYLGLRILDISVDESPDWLVKKLEAVGQRPINFLVDLSNFVMLDIGEPMHVFDAEKVEGGITVRYAKEGDLPAGRQGKFTTLDGKEMELDPTITVIADQSLSARQGLAVAGIKGGKKAETDKFSKHIIVEAAHFNPTIIRKASAKLDIKTDSSKRFENDVDIMLPERALRHFVSLLKKEDSDALVGKIAMAGDWKHKEGKIEVKPKFIAEKLGKDISPDEMLDCLVRGSIRARHEGEALVVYPESYRKDLNIPEDIVDEVGRLYGYENIRAKLPKIDTEIETNNALSWTNKTRNFLVSRGYSEISTYTLCNKGEIEIANPLAADKRFYRDNLTDAMEEKLKENLYYADLLGLSKIKLFELGHVYKDGREYMALSIGVAYKKAGKGERINDEIKIIRDELFAELGSKTTILCTIDDSGGIISKNGKTIGATNSRDGILELDFDSLIADLPKFKTDMDVGVSAPKKYAPMSPYPFIVRDVAVFVSPQVRPAEILVVIERNAGELMVRHELFDTFKKEDKVSYAYRLVFQSYEKTLTDDEVNKIVEKIWDALKGKGWEVR